tara:strand:+ start:2129 stop:2533 length:405 start_codon:yes stop_codon:yes gene_type:complete
MSRVRLLKLDQPTEMSGKIYSKASVRQWIKSNKRPEEIYGEFGQPDLKTLVKGQKTSVDPSNVCVKFKDFKIEDGYLTADHVFYPPLGELLVGVDDTVSFRLRGYVNNRTEGKELIYDIVEIVAFDAVKEEEES